MERNLCFEAHNLKPPTDTKQGLTTHYSATPVFCPTRAARHATLTHVRGGEDIAYILLRIIIIM